MDMVISAGNIITIVTIVVGLAVTWGAVQQQLKEHTKRLAQHDAQLGASDACLLEIKVKLAEIARDILYIRERLDKEGR